MRFALVLAVGILAGCAGTNFSFDAARTVKLGMTEQEVTQRLGAPYMVQAAGPEQVWVWSYASAFGGVKTVSFRFKDGQVVAVPSLPESFK